MSGISEDAQVLWSERVQYFKMDKSGFIKKCPESLSRVVSLGKLSM